ncbi:hypothetical protein PanWU01x14_015450 [Parasponia andersonii]|uniref:Uncharacterized protein n=1 Tax=Parasponia andersonii TaxID=3476 RepID=A0A2P5E0H5_PARAD|nr:hypothetical protein PanWU01x14_015450 [Parasponia andersonii]
MPNSDHNDHHQVNRHDYHSQHQLPKKSFRIKQDDKFFSRLLSKETSQPNSSCRVYYGEAAGAVPFVWESQPGTPKHTFETTSLPPLTPPPSYSTTNNYSISKSEGSKLRPLLLLTTIFRKKPKTSGHNKLSQPPSSSLSSLSSSSSSSSWSVLSSNYSASTIQKGRFLSWNLRIPMFDCAAAAHYNVDDHDAPPRHAVSGSPSSTLRFPVMRKKKDWISCV